MKGKKIYIGDTDNVRYALGEEGNNPLICFGINPSIASDVIDDPTIKRIKNIVKENNLDGWGMLNIYPQRATNPDNMHEEVNRELVEENIRIIKQYFTEYPDAPILAAWGDLICKKPYLKGLLQEIIEIDSTRTWYCRGGISKKKNPRHQLYIANNSLLLEIIFDETGNAFYK